MPRIFAALTAAAFVSAATVALSTQAEAGHTGCRADAGGALSGAYTHGRYGKYEFGYCAGYAYGGPPPYIPPPYYEHEPAYDGYAVPAGNPNVYYDYPAYRRVYDGARRCCRPYWYRLTRDGGG